MPLLCLPAMSSELLRRSVIFAKSSLVKSGHLQSAAGQIPSSKH